MCKIMIMSGITDGNRGRATELIKAMAKVISPGNKDGLGYAAIGVDGKLFGERWLENSQAFTNDTEMTQFGDAVDGVGEYSSFGEIALDKISAITLHTRMATAAKGMMNTHPFVYDVDDTSLIHNGIIDNDSDFKLRVSTCDSEAILQAYLMNEVNKNPMMIGEMAKSLHGYYAAALFSRDADGNRILDIFKGNHASLVVTYLHELGTYVFTTSEGDIASACRELKISMGKAYTIKEGYLLRIDPFTSKVTLREKFTVSGRFKQTYQGASNFHGHHHHSSREVAPLVQTQIGMTSTMGTEINIVDASNSGFKSRHKALNEDMFNMLKLTPGIREMGRSEVRELGMANGWWARQ